MDNPLRHVVLVPDGNRRWARARHLPPQLGHREGAKAAVKILQTALKLDIPCVTLWGASVSNLTERTKPEVAFLYRVFGVYFRKLLKEKTIYDEKVRVNVLGRWEEFFPEQLRAAVRQLIEATKTHDEHQLTFLLGYDGRDEMLAAVRSIAEEYREGKISAVTADVLKRYLLTRDLPPVDLVIRTGGEPHWSAGLLMWDVAEARLHFTKTLWPDFAPEEFQRIIGEYHETKRRFGA